MSAFKQKFDTLSKPLGYFLIGLSSLCWLAVFTIPFLDLETLEIAGIITALIIVGELGFYIAILLLGKPYWERIKDKLKQSLEKAKQQ